MKNAFSQVSNFMDFSGLSFDEFYCISIWDKEISLQASFTSDISKKMTKLGFSGVVSTSGYLEFKVYMDNCAVNIILT